MNNSKRESWQDEVQVNSGLDLNLDVAQAFMYFVMLGKDQLMQMMLWYSFFWDVDQAFIYFGNSL